MRDEPPTEGAKQGVQRSDRGDGGRFLLGHSVATRWPPGESPNPGGKPRGPVAALGRYMAGEEPLPEAYAARLPAEVQEPDRHCRRGELGHHLEIKAGVDSPTR